MATNLDIDPRLLERAVQLGGERTKTAAVTRALEEYVARREQPRVLELFGSLDWDRDYDYKGERSRG
ncbi:MAG: type II toxin-antitoxin system VapB family antitoxin [Chloroflexi bacterium]|nr:type II toxin-antitoxin system VapB family antitoxin [Chloroflexota bacterium]